MIPAIGAHFMIGVGGLVCGQCGRKFCRHTRHIVIATGFLLIAEATTSVIVIDHLIK